MFECSEFPDKLKLADVSPIFKADDSTLKFNFRPISVLPALSKVLERIMAKQMTPFANTRLSSLLCGFRDGYSTQHALFRLIEACRSTLDKKGYVGMVLMDLSKAYDCLPHDLLMAKLAAYGLGLESLKLFSSYLSNRKQRVKYGNSFSEWQNIESGVPQGSVLGPFLFNIFMNDFTYAITKSEFCNFADDNTIYACSQNLEHVVSCLKDDTHSALCWFRDNGMVANPSKFQVMFLGLKSDQEYVFEIDEKPIPATSTVKLLGITIDCRLKFSEHVNTLCKKANNKTSAFSRVAEYLDQDKRRILYNTFIMSNFNYCPLIWMFCGKDANVPINRVHKRALRIMWQDIAAPFAELLARGSECTIHIRNLQKLMLEIYKCLNSENPSFMWNIFQTKDVAYNLRTKNLLQLPSTNTLSYGNDSLSFRGAILWNTLSDSIKSLATSASFKRSIKEWKGDNCSCKICR